MTSMQKNDLVTKIAQSIDYRLTWTEINHILELVELETVNLITAEEEVPTVTKLLASSVNNDRQHDYSHILPNAVFFADE